MVRSRPSLLIPLSRRSRQRGFNFAEVLFAVMILGIGFIMIAAIFPVALVQSKLTQEETTGQSIARGGANYIEQIATDQTLPVSNNAVRSLGRMPQIQGKLNVSSDNRLAWIPLYRRIGDPADRTTWALYAQVYMIPTAARNRSAYDKGPATGAKGNIPPVVQTGLPATPTLPADYIGDAVLVANIVDSKETVPPNTLGVDYIEFPATRGANDTNDNYTAVAEGSYVIIASGPAAVATGEPLRVGHIFRIGTPAETQPTPATAHPRRWMLTPGYDYVPQSGDFNKDGDRSDPNEGTGPLTLNEVNVFVVGRSLADPSAVWNAASNPREGNGQEVGAYTTFVQIR